MEEDSAPPKPRGRKRTATEVKAAAADSLGARPQPSLLQTALSKVVGSTAPVGEVSSMATSLRWSPASTPLPAPPPPPLPPPLPPPPPLLLLQFAPTQHAPEGFASAARTLAAASSNLRPFALFSRPRCSFKS